MASAILVLLSIWLGAAILVAAVVAPAAFKVLPSRTLAGALVGEVLPVIFYAGILVATITIVLQTRSGNAMRLRAIVPLFLIVAGCGIAQFAVAPRIEAARSEISGPVDSVLESDPRRQRFGRLHAFSVLWMGVAMLGAAAAIGITMYDSNH